MESVYKKGLWVLIHKISKDNSTGNVKLSFKFWPDTVTDIRALMVVHTSKQQTLAIE